MPVLKCLAGAQVVLGWCSNCARVVLKLCSAGAQLCFSCGPSGARFVVPLDLSLPRLLFSFLWTAIFAVSVCFFCAFFFCVFLFFFGAFLIFFVFFLCFLALFLCLLVLVLAVGTYASMKFCDLGFGWAQGLGFKV